MPRRRVAKIHTALRMLASMIDAAKAALGMARAGVFRHLDGGQAGASCRAVFSTRGAGGAALRICLSGARFFTIKRGVRARSSVLRRRGPSLPPGHLKKFRGGHVFF